MYKKKTQITFQDFGQFYCEHANCQFTLIVCLPFIVRLVRVQIALVDLAGHELQHGHIYHAAGRALLQTVHQQAGQQEVTHVIDAQMGLDALFGHRLFAPHHAGVVDQHVKPVEL